GSLEPRIANSQTSSAATATSTSASHGHGFSTASQPGGGPGGGSGAASGGGTGGGGVPPATGHSSVRTAVGSSAATLRLRTSSSSPGQAFPNRRGRWPDGRPCS